MYTHARTHTHTHTHTTHTTHTHTHTHGKKARDGSVSKADSYKKNRAPIHKHKRATNLIHKQKTATNFSRGYAVKRSRIQIC